jgi:hypothetical protein
MQETGGVSVISFAHFKSGENEKFNFLQLPLLLIKDDMFNKISSDAKVLYSLLLNRTHLSVKNGWVDDNNNIFIIYTIEQIMEDLNCWEPKAIKAMKELKEIGLVKSVRQGLGKPNITYVMNFSVVENPDNPQSCENHNSGIVKITNQELRKSQFKSCENHNVGILIFSNNDLSHSQSQSQTAAADEENRDKTLTSTPDVQAQLSLNISTNEKEPVVSSAVQSTETSSPLPSNSLKSFQSISPEDKFIVYRNIIQENIEYSHYSKHRPRDIEMVDELVSCMLDVICTEGKTVRVNGEQKNREMVKSQYLKINSMDIDHIIDRYKEQRHKITHVHSYLKTMLYTVKQEISAHSENAVRADGVV